MKPSKKWLRMAELYERFAHDWRDSCKFSEEAKQAMFDYESRGIGKLGLGVFNNGKQNGYAVGKHWLDVQVSSWIEDLGKTLWLPELYDGSYPIWWLDSIFKEYTDDKGIFHYTWLKKSKQSQNSKREEK